jgi:urease beta subunit
MIPGEIVSTGAPVECNAGAPVTLLVVTNTGSIPVHVTAHFHVFEANPRLRFDRLSAYGKRLDTHAKGSVRFEPGETKEIALVPISGARVIHGFNGAVDGPLDQLAPEVALERLIERGFLHTAD